MGKCKFNNTWLERDVFKAWLKPAPNTDFEAYCCLCKKTLKLGTLGVRALESHSKSEKHVTAVKGLKQTAINQFSCSSTSTASSTPPQDNGSAAPVDLRVVFGSSEPTLRAEVLWILHTVTQQNSYSADEDIGDLFQTMFPDSDIAKSFKCGEDETAYITRFGLADFIRRELMSGQAAAEEGFSVKKEIETCNMEEDTLVAQRLVCDYVTRHGGVTKVPLTKELLDSVASARTRYRLHHETERKKNESFAQGQKRKATEEILEELKQRRTTIETIAETLCKDADRYAEQAEGESESQMAQLITKSNTLRKTSKEITAELKNIEEEILAKREELRFL